MYIRNCTSKRIKETFYMVNTRITVTSVTRLRSSSQVNKENMATGSITDNQINKW